MKRTLARTIALVGLSSGLALSGLGVANADPKGETFQLVCGGTTYEVITFGNGHWTPALDVNGNKVFIPHAFGGFYGEVRDEDSNLVESFTEPGATQGSGKQKNDTSCTFSFHEVSDGSDPQFPAGYTFDGGGSVTGQVVGR